MDTASCDLLFTSKHRQQGVLEWGRECREIIARVGKGVQGGNARVGNGVQEGVLEWGQECKEGVLEWGKECGEGVLEWGKECWGVLEW